MRQGHRRGPKAASASRRAQEMRFLLAILLLLIASPAWAQQGQGMSQALVVSSCGGGTLPSGPVNQLTMDRTGRLCQSGIGSNVCSQATAYLARTTGGNEGGNAVNITALICGLVTDGLITGTLTGRAIAVQKLDALYILAQQNAADALLNLCGTSYSLIPANSPTFTTYRGMPSEVLDTSTQGLIQRQRRRRILFRTPLLMAHGCMRWLVARTS